MYIIAIIRIPQLKPQLKEIIKTLIVYRSCKSNRNAFDNT